MTKKKPTEKPTEKKPEPTIEERLAALERQVDALETKNRPFGG